MRQLKNLFPASMITEAYSRLERGNIVHYVLLDTDAILKHQAQPSVSNAGDAVGEGEEEPTEEPSVCFSSDVGGTGVGESEEEPTEEESTEEEPTEEEEYLEDSSASNAGDAVFLDDSYDEDEDEEEEDEHASSDDNNKRPNRQYNCDKCGMLFDNFSTFRSHKANAHFNVNCSYCSKIFINKQSFKVHLIRCKNNYDAAIRTQTN